GCSGGRGPRTAPRPFAGRGRARWPLRPRGESDRKRARSSPFRSWPPSGLAKAQRAGGLRMRHDATAALRAQASSPRLAGPKRAIETNLKEKPQFGRIAVNETPHCRAINATLPRWSGARCPGSSQPPSPPGRTRRRTTRFRVRVTRAGVPAPALFLYASGVTPQLRQFDAPALPRILLAAIACAATCGARRMAREAAFVPDMI